MLYFLVFLMAAFPLFQMKNPRAAMSAIGINIVHLVQVTYLSGAFLFAQDSRFVDPPGRLGLGLQRGS
ncbi:MAG: hypothetical protein CMN05_07075 [Roseibacillus sp.]|jgi:hypothetical protein|nr:hypothetical protein [Roseibacillus sp.]|tara:strand:+ start:38217 stop:38420 length:204 start_codon:yes stop_codon:yes gene_type:complete